MKKLLLAGVTFLTAALLLTGGAAAGLSENLNVTYHIGESYTDIQSADAAADGYYLAVLHDGIISLMKTDANGKQVWSCDNLTGNEARGVTALSEGGCVFLTTDGTDSTLYRVSADGKVVYELPLPGIGIGANPIVVSGGQIKLAGWFTDTDRGFTQSFLLSTGAPANDQLTLPENRVPSSIIADGDAYILVGGTSGKAGNASSEAWIMKMKNGGVIVYDKVIRTGYKDAQYGNGSAAFVVCKTSDGGYAVAGSATPFDLTTVNGLIWAAKLTADGDVVWDKDLKGQIPAGIAQIGSQYIIAGFGWSAPFYITLTEGGATAEVVYPENPGQFNDLV
ncbi:MAG: hypothetical protein Q4Q04_03835, partial [Methanocorpusculum sp.]|nr:hypothetical protein [Methanocorpusculum sp.]